MTRLHIMLALWLGGTLLMSGCARSSTVASPGWTIAPRFGAALEVSLAWLDDPASDAWYPGGVAPNGTSRETVRARLRALRAALADRRSGTPPDPLPWAWAEPTADVLITAYATPEARAARQRSAAYPVPLRRRPSDLPRGALGPPRRTIEAAPAADEDVVAWLADPLEAYLLHVNGSGVLRFADDTSCTVTHDGTNERAYVSLGQRLAASGVLPPDGVTLDAIRDVYRADPARVGAVMLENDRYVYFRRAPHGPRGGLDMALTPDVTVAVDPAVYAPGDVLGLTFTTDDGTVRRQLVLAQDIGGAIRGAQRVDRYLDDVDRAGAVVQRGAVSQLSARVDHRERRVAERTP